MDILLHYSLRARARTLLTHAHGTAVRRPSGILCIFVTLFMHCHAVELASKRSSEWASERAIRQNTGPRPNPKKVASRNRSRPLFAPPMSIQQDKHRPARPRPPSPSFLPFRSNCFSVRSPRQYILRLCLRASTSVRSRVSQPSGVASSEVARVDLEIHNFEREGDRPPRQSELRTVRASGPSTDVAQRLVYSEKWPDCRKMPNLLSA